jgi:hypothetical protein
MKYEERKYFFCIPPKAERGPRRKAEKTHGKCDVPAGFRRSRPYFLCPILPQNRGKQIKSPIKLFLSSKFCYFVFNASI